MAKDEKKEREKVDLMITSVYKVNLHCRQCARKIQKPLMRTQGVHKVDVNIESGEIKVSGTIDPKKIHERIERESRKKVEMVSPKGVIKEKTESEKKVKDTKQEKKGKDTKEPSLRKTSVKVHLHCEKCEHDLRKKLLKHKGVYNVKTETKTQTVTVEGTIEPEKLVSYIQKKVRKHAEIVTTKPERKEETKEKKEVEVKSTDSAKIIEFKEERKVEVIDKDGKVPYFIHYVYAPQLFSDENPNACSLM